MADKKPPKRYEVRTQDKLVRRTDDIASAEQKMQELRNENISYFRFTDKETGYSVTYKKETHQVNYRKVTVLGNQSTQP